MPSSRSSRHPIPRPKDKTSARTRQEWVAVLRERGALPLAWASVRNDPRARRERTHRVGRMKAIDALIRPDRYPLSSRYDPRWLLDLDMGPHPLWQLEDILPALALRPEMRVLDLGPGYGATSVFLARECGVTVTACDLWIDPPAIEEVLRGAGLAESITVVQADVRDLPFPDDAFDAIVSIDAFEYFGTDVHLLPLLLRVLKPGGTIGMTTPGLKRDPYEERVPDEIWSLWGYETAAWHSPEWWRRHWELSGLLEDIETSWLPDALENWILWMMARREANGTQEGAALEMLQGNEGQQLGFVSAIARKRLVATT
jgi:SAM-dependent methyltransferase